MSRRVRTGLRPILFMLLPLLLSGCLAWRVVRVGDGSPVTLSEISGEISGVRAVFVGEYHDRAAHHSMQLKIIKALAESGRPLAIGLEMFTVEDQHALDRWVGGRMDEAEFKKVYRRNWNVDWRMYRPIFVYARERSIPLVALNVPKEIKRRILTEGTGSLTHGELAMVGDLKCDVDKRYEALIKDAMGEHGDMEANFAYFCMVQMVWDNFMARRITAFLEKNPERVMVVLAGSAHAWKRGVPRKLKKISSFRSLVILPEAEDDFDRAAVTTGDADYLWLDPFF